VPKTAQVLVRWPMATAKSTWAILKPSWQLSVTKNLHKLEMDVVHVTLNYPLNYNVLLISIFSIIFFTTVLLLLD
jgi:hypothetical protein